MKNLTTTHPAYHKVCEFIKENFRDGFLIDIRDPSILNGRLHFNLIVSDYDDIHHLIFNDKGELYSREIAPAFPTDQYEDGPAEEYSLERNN